MIQDHVLRHEGSSPSFPTINKGESTLSQTRAEMRKFRKKKRREKYLEKSKNIARSKKKDSGEIINWAESRVKNTVEINNTKKEKK